MDNRLKALFDFQRFHGNPRLERMIAKAEKLFGSELGDNELALIAAAGETDGRNQEDTADDI